MTEEDTTIELLRRYKKLNPRFGIIFLNLAKLSN